MGEFFDMQASVFPDAMEERLKEVLRVMHYSLIQL